MGVAVGGETLHGSTCRQLVIHAAYLLLLLLVGLRAVSNVANIDGLASFLFMLLLGLLHRWSWLLLGRPTEFLGTGGTLMSTIENIRFEVTMTCSTICEHIVPIALGLSHLK